MKTKKSITTLHYRQGDVLIERTIGIPINVTRQKPSAHIILAHGEATGHHHALKVGAPVDWFQLNGMPSTDNKANTLAGELYLALPTGGTVEHPEHSAIKLPPGNYRITRQREYSPGAIRNVKD